MRAERRHKREAGVILRVAGEALDALLAMRAAEGKSLEADLRRNAKAIVRIAARIEKRMPGVVRAHMENLERRIAELLRDTGSVQAADLSRELAVIADRIDVSEELARLESHIAQLEKLLTGAGAVGRKLDFLSQELFREANTIGAKCKDA
jgi:uncharacterized protein (TIGR00255 family)